MHLELARMELDYIRCFSKEIDETDRIDFIDEAIEDMFTHNFIYLKQPLAEEAYIKLLEEEVRHAKESGSTFLAIQFDFMDEVLIHKAQALGAELSTYSYYQVEKEAMDQLKERTDCEIKQLGEKELEAALAFDLKVSEGYSQFAKRRFERRSQVYLQEGQVDNYLCYYQGEVIGHCDLFIKDRMAKVEDFEVLPQMQKKGFGTTILKNLCQKAYERGAEIIYLITDAEDTAKEMYEKCGMKKVGT